jgi:hypothetical protein
MTSESLLLKLTGNPPIFRIIDFLVENKGLEFTKKDIVEGADISKASLFNCWPELELYGIVKPTRKFGKTTLYTLNAHNPIVKKLLELESALIRQSMNQSSAENKREIYA